MKKLSHLVNHRLHHHSLGKSADAAQVLHTANHFLGELFTNSVDGPKAYQFKDGSLFISTQSATWSQEIWGVQNKILTHLNLLFGNRIKKIHIKHLTSE